MMESDCDGGGSGAGERRLWKVLVFEENPFWGSVESAIDVLVAVQVVNDDDDEDAVYEKLKKLSIYTRIIKMDFWLTCVVVWVFFVTE